MDTERLKTLAISETGFIFDPTTGTSFNTSSMGIEIINHLKSGKDLQAVIDALVRDYEVNGNELEADVRDFLQSLKHFNLIC